MTAQSSFSMIQKKLWPIVESTLNFINNAI